MADPLSSAASPSAADTEAQEAVGLFAGTAEYYLRYRPRYPEALMADLAARFDLREGKAVLDLGCGPGFLAVPLAARGARVFAVDPQPEMLDAGRREAEAAKCRGITWLQLTAEALAGHWAGGAPALHCATLGRSFHWMQRASVLDFLDRVLAPEGGVVLVEERRPDEVAWRRAVRDYVTAWHGGANPVQHLNERRRSGIEHRDLLAASAFSVLEKLSYPVARRWPLDHVIGYVYSTSAGNPGRLGAGIDAFEAGLRERLAALPGAPDFAEEVEVTATIARRP